MSDETTAPLAPTQSLRAVPDAFVELAPTIRDHAERLKLAPWQVTAIVARMHGDHDADGLVRTFPIGVDANTRLSVPEFDAAADVALKGRI